MVPEIRDMSLEGITDQDMKEILSVSTHRYANDDKFYVNLLFKDRDVVKKIIFLKNIADANQEEDSGFKPPLFLIGIGLAILYQVMVCD